MSINFIVGNIGSGKSTVSKILRRRMIPVLDTDQMMKEIYTIPSISSSIKAYYGMDAFANGNLNERIIEMCLDSTYNYHLFEKIVADEYSKVIEQMNRIYDDYFIETACIPEWLSKKLIHGGYNSHRKVRLFEIEAPFPTRKARVINRYKEKTGNDMTIEQVMRIDKTEKLQNSLYGRFKTLLNEHVIKSHHIYHNIELDKIDEIAEQIDLERYDGSF